MAYVACHSNFQDRIEPYRPAASVTATSRPRLWRRILEALLHANQRQAERDISRFVSTRGRFTDSVEREIGERMMRQDWTARP